MTIETDLLLVRGTIHQDHKHLRGADDGVYVYRGSDLERANREAMDAVSRALLAVQELQRTVEVLTRSVATKQAQIDALMLEYEPESMSQEQVQEWAALQREVQEEAQPRTDFKGKLRQGLNRLFHGR